MLIFGLFIWFNILLIKQLRPLRIVQYSEGINPFSDENYFLSSKGSDFLQTNSPEHLTGNTPIKSAPGIIFCNQNFGIFGYMNWAIFLYAKPLPELRRLEKQTW